MTQLVRLLTAISLLAALCLPAAAGAEEEPRGTQPEEIRLPNNSNLYGSWRGTLGGQEILVCIADRHAAYYTVGHYSRVAMTLKNAGALLWQEEYPQHHNGIWKLDADNNSVVTGLWSDPEGKDTKPIKLTRMQSSGEHPRLCEEIYAQLADAEPITKGSDQDWNGLRYREISILGKRVSSVDILDGSGKYDALNKYLHDDFHNKAVSAFACQDMQYFELDENREFPYGRSMSLFALNGPWITLLDNGGGSCGAEHANNLPDPTTLVTDTAKPLNLSEWLVTDSERSWQTAYDDLYPPPEKLTTRLYELAAKLKEKNPHNQDPDCSVLSDSNPMDPMFRISLGTNGVLFSTSYAPVTEIICDGYGVEIPFNKLTPFLTSKGKQAVKLLERAKLANLSGKAKPAPAR